MSGPPKVPPGWFCLNSARSGREEVAGVERGVAEELEGVAVELVAARLGDDVDDAAVVVAVLGIEVVRQQAEFRIESRLGTTPVPPFMRSCTSLPLTRNRWPFRAAR